MEWTADGGPDSTPSTSGRAAAAPLDVNDLGELLMYRIFSNLTGKECGVAGCVSRAWRKLATDELLWRDLLLRDWGIDTPLCPDGTISMSNRAAYGLWQRDFATYGKLAPRARRAWSTLEGWFRQHLPIVAATFRPGATEEVLDQAAATLGVPIPLALRALYRFHDGQELHMDRVLDASNTAPVHPSLLHGMFGSYTFYDHVVSTRLLPLYRMVRWSQLMQQHIFPGAVGSPKLLFAASCDFGKVLLADPHSGMVKACLADKTTCADAIPPLAAAEPGDGVLRWIEEFANRLTAGRYQAAAIADTGVSDTPNPAPVMALSLFDCAPPTCVQAVTRGVKVVASPLFVPEHSRDIGSSSSGPIRPRFLFAYRISFSLLSVEEQQERGQQRPLELVQLRARNWVIRDSAGSIVDQVRGDGVIGQFPKLEAGGKAFVYQSCTHQSEARGYMEGSFTFSEGPLSRPTGPDFEVQCPLFTMQAPEYIF